MNKIYFGINGQFGDIIIQEPALRKFIEKNPKTKIVLGCHKKYFEILELYKNYHENIIGFKAWDGYDNWPTESDRQYIQEQKFDFMFKPMPKHTKSDWASYYHQAEEAGLMQNIQIENTQINLPLPANIIKRNRTVAISLFPNYPYGGVKAFSYEYVCNIVKVINKIGYSVIHLDGPGEPDIPNAEKVSGTYMDSVRALLSTDLLVTCDTGMSWVASAYRHPTVGFYAWGYNPFSTTSKNWQPTNSNAKYVEAKIVSNISRRDIIKIIHDTLRKEEKT